MHVSAEPFEKLHDHVRFRLDDTFHHDLAGSIPNRQRNAFLVHIHADIFGTVHWGRSFLSELGNRSKFTTKGRPFILAKNFALRIAQSDFLRRHDLQDQGKIHQIGHNRETVERQRQSERRLRRSKSPPKGRPLYCVLAAKFPISGLSRWESLEEEELRMS